MNQTVRELGEWRSYRRHYAKGGNMRLNSYYQVRLEEAPFNAMVILVCGVLAILIMIIAAFVS